LIVDGHSEVLDTEDAVERYLEATSVLQGDM
ncbi:metal ABC transporter ATP-binding protein, partial [Streptococcus pneumoniae]|nr:metal ABC transporter ATP-binding protein [Streptococcus pneumoniae]